MFDLTHVQQAPIARREFDQQQPGSTLVSFNRAVQDFPRA